MKENIGDFGAVKGLKPPFISLKDGKMSFYNAIKDTMEYYDEGVRLGLITEEEKNMLFMEKCKNYIKIVNNKIS